MPHVAHSATGQVVFLETGRVSPQHGEMHDDLSLVRQDRVSVYEAARMLEISRATLYRVAKRGELAISKIGGRAWVRKSELADYLARRDADGFKQRAERAKAFRRAS